MIVRGETLVFFTLQYPYGSKSETFIESEIQYLAESFERVIILPREKNSEKKRTVPPNVEVNDLLISKDKLENHYRYLFSSVRVFLTVFRIYIYTVIFDKNRVHYFKGGYFLYYLLNALDEAKLIQAFIEKANLNKPVFYDYWFVNSTLSLAYLKSKEKIAKLYCRAHGFDVFNERWNCGTVPFREYIVKNINTVFAISSYNMQYIQNQLKYCKEKIKVAYLGVKDGSSVNSFGVEKQDRQFLIVSCANLFPFKQVHRIPEVLKLLKLNKQSIKWVHFGDGECELELMQASEKLPQAIIFDYKGHVENQEVINFYLNSNVDLFISLSLMEGLPVSMMEAQSFGVPILAYGIFGIPEIVNAKTGMLIDLKDTEKEIARKIDSLVKKEIRFERDQIKEFFNQHFNAEHNFKEFTQNILEG